MTRASRERTTGVELVAPRAGLFDGTGPSEVHQAELEPAAAAAFDGSRPPRRRGTTALAVLTVAAFVGIVVVIAAPWSSSGPASPVVTLPTIPTASTVAARPGTVTVPRPRRPGSIEPAVTVPGTWVIGPDGVLVEVPPDSAASDVLADTIPRLDAAAAAPAPGFVLDSPPPGYELVAAADDPAPRPLLPVHVQVWASTGATRTNGRWVAVVDDPVADPSGEDLLAEGEDVDLGGGVTGVMTQSVDGVRTLVWREPGYGRRAISGNGFAHDDFVQVVRLAGRAPSADVVGAAGAVPYLSENPGDGIADPLDVYADVDVPSFDDLWVPNGARSQTTTYATPDRRTRLTIVSHAASIADDALARFLIASPVNFGAGPDPRALQIGSAPALLGTRGDDPTTLVASWEQDGRRVTVTSNAPRDDLARAITTSRQVSTDEWATLERRADVASALAGSPTDPAQSVELGAETDGPVGDWSVRLSQDHHELTIVTDRGSYTRHVDPEVRNGPMIVRSPRATFVIALAPDLPVRYQLHIGDADGNDVVLLPFVQLPGQHWAGAAIGFAVRDHGTADVRGPTGSSIGPDGSIIGGGIGF